MPINQIGWSPCTHTMYHSHEWTLLNFQQPQRRKGREQAREKEKPNHKLNQINAEKFVSIKRLGDVIYTLLNGILVCTYLVLSSNSLCVCIQSSGFGHTSPNVHLNYLYKQIHIFYKFECQRCVLYVWVWVRFGVFKSV